MQYAQTPGLDNGKVTVFSQNSCHHAPPAGSYKQLAEEKIPALGPASIAYGKAKHSLLLLGTRYGWNDTSSPTTEAVAFTLASEDPGLRPTWKNLACSLT